MLQSSILATTSNTIGMYSEFSGGVYGVMEKMELEAEFKFRLMLFAFILF